MRVRSNHKAKNSSFNCIPTGRYSLLDECVIQLYLSGSTGLDQLWGPKSPSAATFSVKQSSIVVMEATEHWVPNYSSLARLSSALILLPRVWYALGNTLVRSVHG